MEKSFFLSIVTPEKTLYAQGTVSLVAPGELGYLGVLVDHAPLVTNTICGKITVRNNKGTVMVFEAESNGFLEVAQNKAVFLLDKCSAKPPIMSINS